jgi:hypothetical protein
MTARVNGKHPTQNPRKNPRFNGAAIRPGNQGNSGGKPGRSGRKPEAYYDLCHELINDPRTRASVKKILANDKHPHFAGLYKHLAEHAYGKPTQPIGNVDSGEVVIRVIREEASVGHD